MVAVLGRSLVDTRARQGCESVTVHRDHDKPNTILLVERWATREDDDAYRAGARGDGAVGDAMAPTSMAGGLRPVRRLVDRRVRPA